jgi:beta-glucosidase
MPFPAGFTWGAATAAYQVEGRGRDSGRGLCVWDMFCRKDGAVYSTHSGEVACDHYGRWREDVQIIKDLGLKAYRLSISWPRLLPAGTGKVNPRGLEFYDRLIDALLEVGVTPFVTLFHWDYPYELYCRGGWLSPESPQWFADYTKVVADLLGDRVRHWITLNEPQVYLTLGHRDGTHAPGLKLAWPDVLRAMHHSLLAHGRAVETLRERCKLSPVIGWAPVGAVQFPVTGAAQDIEAARRRTFAADEKSLWANTIFSDPVCLGRYPEEALRTWGADFPRFTDAEMRQIHQPIDFYGLNIYHGVPVRAAADGSAVKVEGAPGAAMNASHWPIEPASLYWGPRFLYERYKVPIYITENGLSSLDWVALDGAVHDPQRIDFTRRYLLELSRAIRDGVDVRGYFHWSLMDNFEWAEGYRQRFGLVHVDYKSLKRTIKDSGRWYAGLIRTNGLEIAQLESGNGVGSGVEVTTHVGAGARAAKTVAAAIEN